MASLPIFSFVPSTTRVYATAAKGAGGSKEEKGLFDWILGNLTKEDQFYETDPLLQKVEGKNGGSGTSTVRKNSVSIPQKKNGNGGGFGLGGLFTKK
ncbi:cytochrome P450 86A1-like [Hibiscus syriacus]|uniref:Cytochrome P450 86A1-like n=1 Tax=Hibiscus syriacus TaxID=106335 RepID=A0A6A3CWX0_HIBSY|nr:cytochrome P450 86A1-like [Hibiscus syriacus]